MLTSPVYWPWWLAAIALAGLTVGHKLAFARPLGVSGLLTRLARIRGELAAARLEADAPRDDAALEAALQAATLEAFGPEAVRAHRQASAAAPPPTPARRPRGRASLSAAAAFSAAMVLGGSLGAAWRGAWHATLDVDPTFALVFGGGRAHELAALAAGGLLLGAGAALCGGCTTGHGLSGCSRLAPGSVAAMICFIAAATATSLALGGGGR